MAVESILRVSVEDAPFQRFKALWDKYESEVKKQPELWGKVAQQHRALAAQWAKVSSTFSQTVDHLEKANDALSDQEKHLTLSERLWTNMEKSTKGVASNILGATGTLLKWTGIASGISGLLGYFSLHGLDRLGSTASGWRQSAMGLGVSSGQQRAFNIAFDRLMPGHTEGFLSGINTMVSDVSARAPLYMLGVNPNAPTADVAVNALKAIRNLALATPTDQLGILERTRQLGAFGISVEDLRRYKTMSAGEFNQTLGVYGKESGALNLNDRTLHTWQNFVTTMDVVKGKIENVFVTGLSNLAGPVSRLAGGFEHLLQVGMRKNGAISNEIDALAAWLNKFSGTVAKPEFLAKVESFTSDVSLLAKAFHVAVAPLKGWGDLYDAWTGSNGKVTLGGDSWSGLWAGIKGDLSGYFTNFDVNQRLKYMQRAGILDAAMFGGIPLVEVTGLLDRNLQSHVPDIEAAREQRLLQKYGGNFAQALAAYSWDEGKLDSLLEQLKRTGRSRDWENYLPADTRAYVNRAGQMLLQQQGVTVTIINKTGADVNTSVAGLGASQ